jgi:ribosomal protein S18 acetylase RimI-like enzyme
MIDIIQAKNKSDFAEISKLAFEIWTEHYTPIIGTPSVNYMLKKFQTATAIENQILDGVDYYKLIFEGKLSGYLAFYKKESFLFLSKIYVLKSFRGKGIGKIAMKFVEEKAKELNCKGISLTVNRENTNSIKAYKKMGFVNTGTNIADIGEGFVMDDYLMEKIFLIQKRN